MTAFSPFIDLRSDLDVTARPKPPPAPKTKRTRKLIATPDDAAHQPLLEHADDIDVLLAAIAEGENSHNALVSLAGRLAYQGVTLETAIDVCRQAALQRPEAKRDAGWHALMNTEIRRTVEWAYAKFAEQQATTASVLGLIPMPQPQGGGRGNGTGGGPPPPPSGGPGPTPGPGPGPGSGPTPRPRTSGRIMLNNKKAKVASNLSNAITMLLDNPQLQDRLAYDVFAMTPMLIASLPGDAALTAPRLWTDTDTGRLQDFLQQECGMTRVGRETCQHAADYVARMYSYHPVRDYLDALQWDATERLDKWLHRYLGGSDGEYASKIGPMFIIAMVARVYQPGCQCDYAVVLEGPQGALKSKALRILASDAWFSDQVLELRGDARAVSQHLRGLWLVEIGELSSFKNSAIDIIKSFITRRVERYLPRFAHNEVIEPRQGVLACTTNEETYLQDPSGERRFWPYRVGFIDIEALIRDRDQLFAEAVHRYRNGEHWWPEREVEDRLFRPVQGKRFDEDGWTPLVADYLDQLEAAIKPAQERWDQLPDPKRMERPVAQTTLIEVWRKALASERPQQSGYSQPPGGHPQMQVQEPAPERFERRAQNRLGAILTRLGWTHGERTAAARWWIKP
jgi:predicted P-loop ATPase